MYIYIYISRCRYVRMCWQDRAYLERTWEATAAWPFPQAMVYGRRRLPREKRCIALPSNREPHPNGCGSKPMISHFGVGAPPILETIFVGIGMFTGGTGFGPMDKWRPRGDQPYSCWCDMQGRNELGAWWFPVKKGDFQIPYLSHQQVAGLTILVPGVY